jgi:hypothetical protein
VSNTPILQGVAITLLAAERCLTERLPATLTLLEEQWATANPTQSPVLELPAPTRYWRTKEMPGEWVSPGVGLFDPSTTYTMEDGLGAYGAAHTIGVNLILDAGNVSAEDTTAFADALRLYAWGIAYTLQAYLARTEYGGQYGIWRCTPVNSATIPTWQENNTGQYLRAVTMTLTVDQRVRSRPLPVE